MGKAGGPLQEIIFMTVFVVLAGTLSRAQDSPDAPGVSDSSQNAGRSIEDLNLVGSDAAMPPISDSVIDLNSGFRSALFSKGWHCGWSK